MKPEYLTQKRLSQFIDAALAEDIEKGDYTSLAAIPEEAQKKAGLMVKEEGFIAGVEIAEVIFNRVDDCIQFDLSIPESNQVKYGDIVFTVSGNARSLLTAERLVLNCMQRMSGIATYTKKIMDMVKHTGVKVLDTRKTTPNFRLAEKWAVWIGGGTNHRYGLYDMILLKDNHIDFAGGIKQAIRNTRAYLKSNNLDLAVEIETRNLTEIQEVLEEGGVNVIMLDNMAPEKLREAVKLINHQYQTEASGNINEENIVSVAETGVDGISVGALTHSFKSMDMSLKAFS